MKKIPAAVLLLITTFFWGATFTIVKDAINQVDVFVFLSQRFLLSAGIMLPFALLRRDRLNGRLLVHGGVLGSLLFRQPIGRNIRCGLGLTVAGLFLLRSNGSLSFNRGDLLATVCGACVALHLLFTSRFARHAGSDVYLLTTLQLLSVGALSPATTGVTGQRVLVWHPELLWTLAICVLIATIYRLPGANLDAEVRKPFPHRTHLLHGTRFWSRLRLLRRRREARGPRIPRGGSDPCGYGGLCAIAR